jgi:hypothetical protein
MRFTFESGTRPLTGYTIKRAIHRGGFGEVYYAVSDEGREVALKLLQHNSDVELRGVRQCFNLSHPNLVTIFDIRQDDEGDHWVVMEYVDGDTLDQAIRQAPQGMSIGEAGKWLEGITRGVEYLHTRGLVHRDLKPGNIFRTGSTIKVGDVGLSKFVTPSRRSAHTQSVGTVYYMAPEVAKGQYGREVDVYATGVILYEMLTGSVPFDGESTAEILMKHLTEKPNLSLLPPSVREVVGRALEKDPASRYASMNAMWTAFSEAVSGRSPRVSVAQPVVAVPAVNGHHGPSVKPVLTGAAAAATAASTSAFRQWLSNPWSWPILGLMAVIVIPIVITAASTFAGLLAVGVVLLVAWKLLAAFLQGWQGGAASHAASVAETSATDRGHRRHAQPVAHPVRRSTIVRRAGMVRDIAWTTRCMHLTGSAAVSTLCVVLLTAALAMFQPGMYMNVEGQIADRATIATFGVTAVIASWAIILLTKLLEGRKVDESSRRLLLAAAGCIVGAVTWQAGEFLMTGVPSLTMSSMNTGPGLDFAPPSHVPVSTLGDRPLTNTAGQPLVVCSVFFFAALFGLRRWWHQTDELRPCRFRLMSVLLTMALAFVICQLIPFPEIWGVALAAVISCSVQIASVWQSDGPTLRRTPAGEHAQVLA